MSAPDDYENHILAAYERGEFESVATQEELDRIRAAARVTGTKDPR